MWRHRIAPGEVFQQQARVVIQTGLHRGVGIELLLHVLLCVAAAEAVHFAQHRAHQCSRTGRLTLAVSQHGLTQRQRDGADQRGMRRAGR
jgi:hypothetical protein